jgi:hypothetical protein
MDDARCVAGDTLHATGITTTVGIYLDVLEDLARRRNFNIYVQPVAPVSREHFAACCFCLTRDSQSLGVV